MAIPLVIDLMNLVVPLQISARDMGFPFFNSMTFWQFIAGVVLINMYLGVGEFAQTALLTHPPLFSKEYSPDVGSDYWMLSLHISEFSTLFAGINLFTAILKMRGSGIFLIKMQVFTWTSFCLNILIIIAFPILTVTIALLTLDRYIGTYFFKKDIGSNMLIYINLIWAWGHPEVYILVLPVFSVFSEVTATFSRKRLFEYNSLVRETIAITFLAFIVYLHHFFTMNSALGRMSTPSSGLRP